MLKILEILTLCADEMLEALRVLTREDLPEEMQPMMGCAHNPEHHPEDDVWQHTILVCYHAVKCLEQALVPAEWAPAFILGAFFHDIGKPLVVDPETRAMNGHDKAGEEPIRAIMARIGVAPLLADEIIAIVVNHMGVDGLKNGASEKAWRKLHAKLPLNIAALITRCDHAARGNAECPPADMADEYFEKFTSEPPPAPKVEPKLTGKYLQARGMQPGPEFKKILQRAMDAQLANPNLSAEQLFELAVE